jgi:hypothetical protein
MPAHSNENSNFDAVLGYGLLRLTMGLNFLFHSFGRWRNLEHFVDDVVAEFAQMPVPSSSCCYSVPGTIASGWMAGELDACIRMGVPVWVENNFWGTVTLSSPPANTGIDGFWPSGICRGSTGCRGLGSLDGALPAS